MTADPILYALKTPGHLRFPANHLYADDLGQAGGRAVRQASGHLVFYGSDGRRFLATDPAGNPLHECEWTQNEKEQRTLSRARVRLDWGAWVGIKPNGLVNETTLNPAAKSGGQRLTADNLRAMAANALRVPLEEVRWFYRDEDLSISPTGQATIRHRKDALYQLEEGDFDRARFMSCMGAMHWDAIDFLPVVELFKSLLPGTGSAVFELIRGLYDDQSQDRPSPPLLRYRGIPTYPSEAAFRLFSGFFTPQAPAYRDPFTLFMDQTRSHEVTWLPSPSPPLRYFETAQGCCLTFQGGELQKATLADDATGLPFVNPRGRKVIPCDRSVRIIGDKVVAKDRNRETVLPVSLPGDAHEQPAQAVEVSPVDWRSLFAGGVPPIAPQEAYGAVLLYPEDETEIGEMAAQPFVADYIQDLADQDREIAAIFTRADRVLIENGDAVIATCVVFDRCREYRVRVSVPAFAQKQAQQLWYICADLKRWDWMNHMRFVPMTRWQHDPASDSYFDVAYQWVPYAMEDDRLLLLTMVKELHLALRSGGHGFVVGPASLSAHWALSGFRVAWQEPVEGLPTFRMHKSVLPKARLRAGLTLYQVNKK